MAYHHSTASLLAPGEIMSIHVHLEWSHVVRTLFTAPYGNQRQHFFSKTKKAVFLAARLMTWGCALFNLQQNFYGKNTWTTSNSHIAPCAEEVTLLVIVSCTKHLSEHISSKKNVKCQYYMLISVTCWKAYFLLCPGCKASVRNETYWLIDHWFQEIFIITVTHWILMCCSVI